MCNIRSAFVLCMMLVFCCLLVAQESEVKEAVKMEPEIVELVEITVVGLSSLVSTNYILISELWERFSPREKEIKDVAIEGVALEVSFDTKKVESEGTEQEEYEFLVIAGLPVKSTDDIPEGMTYKTVPAHKYAKFIHKGPISKIMDTYNYIYGEWLPKSEHEYDWAACEVARYDERFKMDSEDSEFDIFIPIK